MKIAICDDDPIDQAKIKSYCAKYDPSLETVCFSSGEELLAAFDSCFYDLVFLDIEMGKLNGLELGEILVGRSPKPVIVFTTQSLNYAVHGYGIAIKYLTKPISYETFSKTMVLALEQILPKKLRVVSGGSEQLIAVSDIVYFEVLDHQVYLHLSSGEEMNMRVALSKVIDQLPGGIFVQPHKSFYINMDHIKGISQQKVIMSNGHSIPITRSRREHFQDKLSAFMKGIRK